MRQSKTTILRIQRKTLEGDGRNAREELGPAIKRRGEKGETLVQLEIGGL